MSAEWPRPWTQSADITGCNRCIDVSRFLNMRDGNGLIAPIRTVALGTAFIAMAARHDRKEHQPLPMRR